MAEARVERRLAAILAADVAGYSRLMGTGEEATLAALKACRRELIDPKIAEYRGRIVKTTGDGLLVEFPSAVDAVRCAIEVQRAMAARNAAIPEDRRIEFRIGINVGDIIIDDGDIYGDGVNIAARVESLASPGEICLSDNGYQQIKGKLAFDVRDLGEQNLKNIAQPVRVYGVRLDGTPERPALVLPDKPSIAVLPFQNMSGDPEQEYFADGIAEEITMALARLRGFFVISRNSAFTYKGKPVNVQQVGRELGVQYVLEGSVRKSGDRVRIGVQLANAVTGREFWSARYERALVDVFAVQDEITASIVMAAEPQIYAAERERVQQKPPGRLDAWDCVIRAMSHMWLHTKGSHEAALDLLTSALRLDPDYARALGLHAWLSLWHTHQGWSTAGLSRVLPGAFEQALAAVRIDGEDAWAHLALGFAHMFRREHDDSVEQLRAALDLNPNFAVGHACLGLTLAYGGKGHEGVQHFEKQARLNPRDPFFFLFTGARSFAHFMAGEYQLGLEWGRRAVRHAPEVSGHWRALALSAAMLNLAEEARAAVVMARKFQPDYSVAWVERASPLVHAHDRERYCNILRPFGLPESSIPLKPMKD
jgi:adenylate cyclase